MILEENILIIFPHGIGDFVHLSGVFNAFNNKTNKNLFFAFSDYLISSGLPKRYKFIKGILPIFNPYSNYFFRPNLTQNSKIISLYEDFFEDVIYIKLDKKLKNNAISDISKELKINKNADKDPFFPILEKEKKIAKSLLAKYKSKKNKLFFKHLKSSDLRKNKKSKHNHNNTIEIERNFNSSKWSIGVAAYLMKISDHVELVDSAFLHIAGALKKKVNIAYLTEVVSKGGYINPPNLKVEKEIFTPINKKSTINLKYYINRILIFLRRLFPKFLLKVKKLDKFSFKNIKCEVCFNEYSNFLIKTTSFYISLVDKINNQKRYINLSDMPLYLKLYDFDKKNAKIFIIKVLVVLQKRLKEI